MYTHFDQQSIGFLRLPIYWGVCCLLLFVRWSTMCTLHTASCCQSWQEKPRTVEHEMEQHFRHIRDEEGQDRVPQRALIPHGQWPPLSCGRGGSLSPAQSAHATGVVARHQPLYLSVRKCSGPKAHFMLQSWGQKTAPMRLLFPLWCQLFIISWSEGSIARICPEAMQTEKLFFLCAPEPAPSKSALCFFSVSTNSLNYIVIL